VRPEFFPATTADPLTTFSASTLDLAAPTTSIESVSVDYGEGGYVGNRDAAMPHRQLEEQSTADDDLMIVEEDPRPEVRPHSMPRAIQVRRKEYRQLFSSLRRG
jgi:hypothetical protein